MTFPVYIRLGSFSLHPHAVFETLGYVVGFYVYFRMRQRRGDVLPVRDRTWVVVAAILGGIVGSRVLYLAEDPARFAGRWNDMALLLGGKSIVGGLIGGVAAVEWTKKRLGVIVATGDLLAVPVALGVAIGRVGCFLTGLADRTYGTATTLPWSVDFGDGVMRHPTQIYEMGFLLGLALLLNARGRSLVVQGDQFRLFMLAYMTFRLLVDFVKPGVFIGGLSAIQWACLGAIVYYAQYVPRLTSELRRG